MNYELVMLKSLEIMKRASNSLSREIQAKAAQSYCTLNVRGGTLAQVEEISSLMERRNECEEFYQVVVSALDRLPRSYRALLLTVYVGKVSTYKIAAKYRASQSSVARQVLKARKFLRESLLSLGYDEQWLANYYGDYDVISGFMSDKRLKQG